MFQTFYELDNIVDKENEIKAICHLSDKTARIASSSTYMN